MASKKEVTEMSNAAYDINVLRNIILKSQHLLEKSPDSIEDIVSDICGLQYDPNPTIHLNQYIMLWNRKKDFKAEQLDAAAYKEFKVVETWTFKRNRKMKFCALENFVILFQNVIAEEWYYFTGK